jgi:hypothetical protein
MTKSETDYQAYDYTEVPQQASNNYQAKSITFFGIIGDCSYSSSKPTCGSSKSIPHKEKRTLA